LILADFAEGLSRRGLSYFILMKWRLYAAFAPGGGDFMRQLGADDAIQ
jgi:hypothetical protein